MRPLMILVGLCMIGESIEMLEFHEEEEAMTNQSLCVKMGFAKYFRAHSNILVFSRNSNYIVNILPKLPIFVATEWDVVRETVFLHKRPMIIFLEGNSDQDIYGLDRLRGFVMVQAVLIVCATSAICSSEMYINEIVKIVEIPELHYVALNHRGIIDIYKHTTTAEESCGKSYLLRVGHCSDKSAAKKAFEISLNFHQCPFRIVTWFSPPYSRPCYSYEKNLVCGIEGTVIQFLVEKINATPVILNLETPMDVRRLIANRFGDVGFGDLVPRQHVGVSYSKAYLFIEATVIASYSTWTLEGLMGNIFLPLEFEVNSYPYPVWLGIGVVMAVIFILELLLPHFRKINALEQLSIFLGYPVTRTPREVPSRIYFISLLIFGYICSRAYLSHLTIVFAVPKQKVIRTLGDLERSNLRVTGSSASREKFKDEYPRIYEDFEVEPYAEYYAGLSNLIMGQSESVFYVEASADYISNWRGGRAVENGISWYPVATVAQNSSPILRFTGKLFPLIFESGILLQYQTRSPKANRSARHSDSTLLRFQDLGSVFFLLISGLGISFLVFLTEIMIPYIRMKSRGERLVQIA